jgi:magnesium-transporting ATPase (P-type)
MTYISIIFHRKENIRSLLLFISINRGSNVTHRMFNCDYDLIVSPIGKSNGNSDMITIFSSITSIVAVLILLVALLNFFHFQIGSIINRQREFTIRKIIGNDMFHLAMMLFVQLFLVIVIASLFMFGLIETNSQQMKNWIPNMLLRKKCFLLLSPLLMPNCMFTLRI